MRNACGEVLLGIGLPAAAEQMRRLGLRSARGGRGWGEGRDAVRGRLRRRGRTRANRFPRREGEDCKKYALEVIIEMIIFRCIHDALCVH